MGLWSSIKKAAKDVTGISFVEDKLLGGDAADAAKKAGKIQAKAANTAAEAQLQATREANARLTPYRMFGNLATERLSNDLQAKQGVFAQQEAPNLTEGLPDIQGFDPNSLADNPFLEFANREAMRDITNRAAAGGLLGSGGTLAALGDRLQYNNYNFAQNEFNRLAGLRNQLFGERLQQFGTEQGLQQQQLGNLFNVAQMGQNAAAMQGSNLMQGTGIANDLMTSGAAAIAAGKVGAANAQSAAYGGLLNLAGTIGGAMLGGAPGAAAGNALTSAATATPNVNNMVTRTPTGVWGKDFNMTYTNPPR